MPATAEADTPQAAQPRRDVLHREASRTRPRASTSNRVLAVSLLFLMGFDQTVAQGVTTGIAGAVVLLPVWWSTLRLAQGARSLFAMALAAVASGWTLMVASSADHTVNMRESIALATSLLGGMCVVGMVLWARRVVPIGLLGLAFGAGALVHEVLDTARLGSNPWKFSWGIPVTIVLLSATLMLRSRAAQIAALVGLALFTALHDARSFAAALVMAGILLAWQIRGHRPSRRPSGASGLIMMLVLGVTVYVAGTTIVVDGYLGAETQARSLQQIDTSGSLLLGGRPEWGATTALMASRPQGFGIGVVPSLADIAVAKSGMSALNYDPNNGYVEKYLFGGGFKLHSVVGDFWSYFGVVGVLLAAIVAFLVARSLAVLIGMREASGLVIFLACMAFWNLAFSPMYGSMNMLTLTLGLVLLPRDPDDPLDVDAHVGNDKASMRQVSRSLRGTTTQRRQGSPWTGRR